MIENVLSVLFAIVLILILFVIMNNRNNIIISN